MSDSTLHYGARSLKGTAYYEYKPGRYQGEHWGDDSVFLSDDAQQLIEPLCLEHLYRYNPYGPNTFWPSQWEPFIKALRHAPLSALGSDARDAAMTEKTLKELLVTYVELAAWLEQTLKAYGVISLLGL